jgi:HAD superfamily hydrolase (TIGR01509 family)
MIQQPKAFLFDMNGTMIDDMAYHGQAWHEVLNSDLNAGLTRAEVDKQMYGKNEEVLVRIFGKDYFTPEKVATLSMEKEKRYQAFYRPHLCLIAGLEAFLQKAQQQGIAMAIGTAAIPFNVDFAIDNLNVRPYFKAIVSADDVQISKPHPETFTLCADLLQVPYDQCVVFEDSPKGVEAALNAGMKAVVITTMHPATDFAGFPNVIACVSDYTDSALGILFS